MAIVNPGDSDLLRGKNKTNGESKWLFQSHGKYKRVIMTLSLKVPKFIINYKSGSYKSQSAGIPYASTNLKERIST